MTLLAFGLNHTTAPLHVRENVTFLGDAVPFALTELTGHTCIEEAAILSTCNRTEIYCHLDGANTAQPVDWFSGFHGYRTEELQNYIYTYPDATAVKHVLRVASGLDSMMLGEPQVLGQLKQAYQTALQAGSIGKLLNRLFQHAFKVAKEIRSHTLIGSHPVSVAYASVRLGRQIFGDLSTQTALLIGAGETIELTVKYLRDNGLKKMIIANRTLERSQELARQYAAYAISLGEIPEHLDEADIIISSTASQLPILGRCAIEAAIARRKHRPMFIVDMAVPRDIEPQAGELEDVYLYTVDDLKDIIDDSIKSRRQAAREAERIIDTEVVQFMGWINSLDAVSTISAMRDKAKHTRDEVLQGALQKLRQGADPESLLHEVTHSLTNKLLHPPSAHLNKLDLKRKADVLQLVRALFDLTDADLKPKKRR